MNEKLSLTPIQEDTLTEILNLGVGGAANVLNQMSEEYIEIQVPSLHLLTKEEIKKHAGNDLSSLSIVQLEFNSIINGSASLILSTESAVKLASILQDEEIDQNAPEAEWAETITEVGNIVVNSIMGAVANTFEKEISYLTPQYYRKSILKLFEDENSKNDEIVFLLAEMQFNIKVHSVEAKVIIIFSTDSFTNLITQLDGVYSQSA